MLAKYCATIRNYVVTIFSQGKYTFYHQNKLLERILTTLLAGPFDGDSFVSQSRFDAYTA